MIYRFRIVLDAEEDVFRDLELESSSTFEDLHNVIIQSFGLSGHEMATFYVTDDEWNQGEAIALTDMFEEPSQLMEKTALDDIFTDYYLIHTVLITERGVTRLHLIDHNTKSPVVHSFVMPAPEHKFWRKILRSPT